MLFLALVNLSNPILLVSMTQLDSKNDVAFELNGIQYLAVWREEIGKSAFSENAQVTLKIDYTWTLTSTSLSITTYSRMLWRSLKHSLDNRISSFLRRKACALRAVLYVLVYTITGVLRQVWSLSFFLVLGICAYIISSLEDETCVQDCNRCVSYCRFTFGVYFVVSSLEIALFPFFSPRLEVAIQGTWGQG